jgi:hypothetical protein
VFFFTQKQNPFQPLGHSRSNSMEEETRADHIFFLSHQLWVAVSFPNPTPHF